MLELLRPYLVIVCLVLVLAIGAGWSLEALGRAANCEGNVRASDCDQRGLVFKP